MKRLRIFSVLLSLIIISTVGLASTTAWVTVYDFTQTSGTYSAITGGTVLGTSSNDENVFGPYDIGFNFTFNGTVFTKFNVATNGYIQLGSSTISSTTNPLSDGTANNIISALAEDLQGQTGSTLMYQVIGTSPARTLVVQWTNYRKKSANGDVFNFQVKINENSNTIAVVYNSFTVNSSNSTVQVGLRGSSTSVFNNRSVGSSETWATSITGTSNTSNCRLRTSVKPANGQTYSWSPRITNVYSVTGGGSYCQGTGGVAVGLSGSQPGTTYTLYKGGIAQTPTVAGTGLAISFGNQTGTATYTVKGNGAGGTLDMTGSAVVTENSLPVISFSPLSDVCVGSSSVALSATPSGGTFSGTFVTGNSFNPSSIGTYNITYNYSNPSTGCAAVPVTQPITVKVCTPTWNGLISSEYSNPGNWQGNHVPETGEDVIIPSGCPHYPVLANGASVQCKNMEVGSGAGSPNSALMGISGDFIVDGNLTIKADASMDVFSDGWLTVEGDFTILGQFTLEWGGSLITNGAVTGIGTIKSEMAGDLKWHFLSSPVNQQNICNGSFAPLEANFSSTPVNTWDFYRWFPTCDASLHWRNLRTTTLAVNYADFGTPPAFEVTKGYLVAYGSGFPTTKSFIGTPNTGDKILSFSDIADNCTWSLEGNPYPSAVDWSLVTDKQNLTTDYYYVWNENKAGGAGYEFWKDDTHKSSIDINGNIPPMQGFFVKVSPWGDKFIGMPNSARVHDDNHWLKKTEADVNRLAIKLDNGTNYDQAFVIFENGSSTGADRNDAEKLMSMANGVPQVYTVVDNDQKAGLNSLPDNVSAISVPVGFVAPADGTYSISVSGLETFASLKSLTLEDLQTNTSQNLLQNPVYTFNAAGNEDAGRFILHFAGTIGMDEKKDDGLSIYAAGRTITVSATGSLSNATISVCNLLGQEILTKKLNDQHLNKIDVNALQGYYIVRVKDDGQAKAVKVFIN